jgi:hypothetical protein
VHRVATARTVLGLCHPVRKTASTVVVQTRHQCYCLEHCQIADAAFQLFSHFVNLLFEYLVHLVLIFLSILRFLSLLGTGISFHWLHLMVLMFLGKVFKDDKDEAYFIFKRDLLSFLQNTDLIAIFENLVLPLTDLYKKYGSIYYL